MYYDRQIKYLDYMENGDKVRSSGFVKIEVRDSSCTIQLNVSGLYPTDTFEREVWIRGGGKECVLGEIRLLNGQGQAKWKQLDVRRLGRGRIAFDELECIQISISRNRELVCLWQNKKEEAKDNTGSLHTDGRDERSRPSGGMMAAEAERHKSGRTSLEQLAAEMTAGRSVELLEESIQPAREIGLPETEGMESVNIGTKLYINLMGEGTQTQLPADRAYTNIQPEYQAPDKRSGIHPEYQEEKAVGELQHEFDRQQSYEKAFLDWSAEEEWNDKPDMKKPDLAQPAVSGEAPDNRTLAEHTGGGPDNVIHTEINNSTRTKSGSCDSDNITGCQELMEDKNPETAAPYHPESKVSQGNPVLPPRIYEDKWKQLSDIYPHIAPFHDERDYLSIGPGDFVIFSQNSYKLVSNSFLLHGFYNYGHLILTRIEKKGETSYYIGVPGNFYEREKQVAVMFGFESFECKTEPAQAGDYGYYLIRAEI